jgi:hypothetical protein
LVNRQVDHSFCNSTHELMGDTFTANLVPALARRGSKPSSAESAQDQSSATASSHIQHRGISDPINQDHVRVETRLVPITDLNVTGVPKFVFQKRKKPIGTK